MGRFWIARGRKIKYWHIVWTINKQGEARYLHFSVAAVAAASEITLMFHNQPNLYPTSDAFYCKYNPTMFGWGLYVGKLKINISDYSSAFTHRFSFAPTIWRLLKVINLNLHFLGARYASALWIRKHISILHSLIHSLLLACCCCRLEKNVLESWNYEESWVRVQKYIIEKMEMGYNVDSKKTGWESL